MQIEPIESTSVLNSNKQQPTLEQMFGKKQQQQVRNQDAVELAYEQERQKLMPAQSPDEIQYRKKRVAALLQQAEVEKQQQEWRNGEENKQAGQTLVHGQLLKWKQGKLLGSGTTGQVFEALNTQKHQLFAVKKIRLMHNYHGLDQNKVRSIKKEIDTYLKLKHKNIVKYLGGEMIPDNVFCIYLEYLKNGSVADMYKDAKGPLGEALCRNYTVQVLDAIGYLHDNDIVHGDIKGSNVLLDTDGSTVKLCDLGNSRMLEQNKSFTSVTTILNGSLAWMAPEAIDQRQGKRSDVWSIGCFVVEMLVGGNPWGTRYQDLFGLQKALREGERPYLSNELGVSEACRQFIARCLVHKYKDRPYIQDLKQDPWINNNN